MACVGNCFESTGKYSKRNMHLLISRREAAYRNKVFIEQILHCVHKRGGDLNGGNLNIKKIKGTCDPENCSVCLLCGITCAQTQRLTKSITISLIQMAGGGLLYAWQCYIPFKLSRER